MVTRERLIGVELSKKIFFSFTFEHQSNLEEKTFLDKKISLKINLFKLEKITNQITNVVCLFYIKL